MLRITDQDSLLWLIHVSFVEGGGRRAGGREGGRMCMFSLTDFAGVERVCLSIRHSLTQSGQDKTDQDSSFLEPLYCTVSL